MHIRRLLAALAALALLGSLFAISPVAGANPQVQTISDAQLKALDAITGGANVLPTTRTVPHWFGSTLDPHDGVTYGYNMVGANPDSCSGSACDVTIEADITPVIVNVGGLTFTAQTCWPPRWHRRSSRRMTMGRRRLRRRTPRRW